MEYQHLTKQADRRTDDMQGSRSNRKLIIIGAVVGVVILSLLIAVIALAARGSNDEPETGPCPNNPNVEPRFDFLSSNNKKDGLNINWYTGEVKSIADVQNIARGDYDIVEVKLIGTQTKIVVRTTAVTVSEIIDTLKSTKTSLKLDLESVTSFNERAKELMQTVVDSGFGNPVFITVPVASNINVNITEFIADVNTFNPDAKFIINFDLTLVCCKEKIGKGLMEYLDELISTTQYQTSVELDARSLMTSWPDLRWLLEKNGRSFLIITSTTATFETVEYDLLKVRNDISTTRLLYNLGTMVGRFRQTSVTGGSPLDYFNITPRDAGKIIWSHNTDTWEQLNAAIAGDVMMIEGDIQLHGQGTPQQTNEPIMAHDYGDFNNITFKQWLDEIIKAEKGMKFDFKSFDAVIPALTIANKTKHLIKGPVWLNADIQQGPGAGEPRINATLFLEAVSYFPEATLSLGWTTVAKGNNTHLRLTMDMAEKMNDLCKDLKQPVTFPARAEQLKDSWEAFDWLLSQSRGYSITVWTGHGDAATKADMDYIKRQGEQSRIYFDLPEDLRPSF